MKDGKVYSKLLVQLKEEAGLLFLVIDPPNQSPEEAGNAAKIAEKAGVSAIAVGGSLGAQGKILDDTLTAIKNKSALPTILFPGNIATLSKLADATYFMSMLNSNDPYYISGAQTAASFPIKKMGLEVIPTSYIIVEPGRAVGFMGRAQLIPRNLSYLAAATALAGQYMGSKIIILESGGGAPEPVPKEMIVQTKSSIEVPLVVAGGVRTPEFAYDCISSGADIVHVGSAIEKTKSDAEIKSKLEKLVEAVKKGAKAKK
ncbi:MAG: geranylgeranylglyceryl/heptaprenylglyceryl phosphate synthase [Candidatus Diapherotrites archaeon]|nr:geranylgeranylglyceryl/heptaprenylglyceryl phosphate synthase [Candidatus Diapherotrites archaeon]